MKLISDIVTCTYQNILFHDINNLSCDITNIIHDIRKSIRDITKLISDMCILRILTTHVMNSEFWTEH